MISPNDPTFDGTRRSQIRPGLLVRIVLKQDQASGKLTQGVVKDILTNAARHPHGIKVRLVSGQVGRVKQILSKPVDPQAGNASPD